MLLLALAPGLAMARLPATQVGDLAAATGLTTRQVQMVLGARTAFAEYRTQYNASERRFVKAIGKQRYEDLMAGREITLDNGQSLAIAMR